MLKNVSNSFINACNSNSITLREYIVLNGVEIPVKARLKDDCYSNGNFVGSFIFKEINFETSNEYDFKEKEFDYYKVVNNESVKLGTFITTEVEDNDTTETVKVIGMDYGLKTQVEYSSNLNYSSGNITLLDVWNECCSLAGIESGIDTFTNSDFIVDSDQFTGTGVMIRDVLIAIAQSSANFVKVMDDNKIYLIFNETTSDIIEDYTELKDKRDTHPLTCVRLGMSHIEGENVDLKDDELVQEYGENWLIINDNPFAYNQDKRAELITAILDKVKGFGYSSFTSKTSFKPYLTCGDVVQFRNKNGDLTSSIILRYDHEFDKITLEAPSETSATVNYEYPLDAITAVKRTEAIVNKNTGDITLLSEETQTIQNNLIQNYYDKTSVDQAIINSQTGLTNTFSEAGGNNIFRNTGLWFENSGDDSETNPYEFWEGTVIKYNEERSANHNALLLQNDTLSQSEIVPNGNYTVSFKYKKLIELANVKVVINDTEYELNESQEKEFQKSLEVNSQQIKIDFISNTNNSCEIYDLMVNAGSVKLAYSQNQNETTTDTVNISKGITITSSADENIQFKADFDGVRIYNKNNKRDPITYFTEKGTNTKEIVAEDKGEIAGVLIQEIGNQTWFTKI